MISAVFDSTTLLQAAGSRKGPAGACLAYVDEGRVKLFLSPVTLDEIRDVLHRPEIRKAFPKLTDENVSDFLDRLVDKGHMIENVPSVYRLERDPNDEPILNLAIAAQAAFIVSRDNDLERRRVPQGLSRARHSGPRCVPEIRSHRSLN